MTKLCSPYAILILLFTSGALMAMVLGDQCKDDFGACQTQGACNSKCTKKHQGGQGLCSGGGKQHCWCNYDCSPRKTCEVTIGYPIGGCDEAKCESDCPAKYGKGATGYCYSIGIPMYDNCHCKYFC